MGNVIGKLKEKLGWLTADRTTEAEGKLEQAAAAGLGSPERADPADEDDAAIEAVAEARRHVQAGYGELGPDRPPR